MSWYWILLIVIGYLIIWVITSVCLVKISNAAEDDFNELTGPLCVGMFWPASLPMVIVFCFIKWLLKIINNEKDSI